MPTPLRSNGKTGFSENNPDGVTILQWFTGFDAALGFRLILAPCDYSKKLHSRRAVAQNEGHRDLQPSSSGWLHLLAWHLPRGRPGACSDSEGHIN
jgi:hypothetical protein